MRTNRNYRGLNLVFDSRPAHGLWYEKYAIMDVSYRKQKYRLENIGNIGNINADIVVNII